jgi:hypothetical protein
VSLACGTARRLLWPDASPQALTPEREAAEAHLVSCEPCQRFIVEMRLSATATREGAPKPSAPVEVRERLFTVLARERARIGVAARPPRPHALGWTVVALAVAGAAVWTVTVRSPSSVQELTAIAEDHVRALQGEALDTADPVAIETWLRARVSFAVHVPRLPGAALEGARLCLLGGRRGAVVRFRLEGEPLSYYVMAEGTGGADQSDAAAFREETDAGYNVVAWRRDGLIHALVGALPRERLAGLARICTEQLAVALPRTEQVQ